MWPCANGLVAPANQRPCTEAKYLWGVEDQFRALQRDLVCMQQFLQDTDDNPNLLKQDGQLRILTLEMQELAFRAEDAIDTYLVDVGSKIYNKSFLLKFVILAYHSYRVHMQRQEIEDIQQEIKVAINRSGNFRGIISATRQLQGACAGSSYSNPVAENYIHLDDEFVVGIGDDITRLVKHLTNPHDDFQVLGIVGTGGAGKTTLPSQIYRHAKVQNSFSHKAFVSISQQWSKLDLLHRISKEILGRLEISSSERELMKELHDFMKDKRCLLVLDDIWKKEACDDIYPIFPHTQGQGIKVILTTRKIEVPRHADIRCVLHEPNRLTNDQMWELFSKGALEGRHGIEIEYAVFEKLGKLMLQKCRVLPLAVVTLVGILKTKNHVHEWEQVNATLSGKILEGRGGFTYGIVEEMLELSYLDLPAHLKPLFLYLSMIPEDHVWPSKRLIKMWIAEGFVADDQTDRCETLEDKAMQFLNELAQRYIIRIQTRNLQGEIDFLYMHDMMREFCIKKARECQFLEYISSTCSYGTRSNKPRRLTILSRGEYCLEESNYLRTILFRGLPYESGDGVKWKMASIHKDFKLVKVLRITYCANKTLPTKIGNLIHLTYLSVTYTKITELPKSVRKLLNLIHLEFLPLVKGVTSIVPDALVVNMKNLRVLRLPDKLQKRGSKSCKRLGLNNERHKKLHTFKCGAGRWMAKDVHVMHLLPLRDLTINSIDEIEDMEAIHQFLGFMKGSLQIFECTFEDEGVSKELKFNTDKLMGSQTLHTLYLAGRLVKNFTIQFPASLMSLVLSTSEIGEEVDLMGILGQLSKLKILLIVTNAYLGRELRCTGTSFPQLEDFGLVNLDNLEGWIVEGGAMGRLKRIAIFGCKKLKRLPPGIRSITTLKELRITDMPEEFGWRLGYKRDENGGLVRTQEEEDSYIIEHIPSVTVSTSNTPFSTMEMEF